MRKAILINGVPATGKTILAHHLVSGLGLPLLSLDTVKEALFDVLGTSGGDREYNRTLGRASKRAIWSLVSEFPEDATVIVEAWFGMPPHDAEIEGLARAGIGRTAEIWCHALGELLAKRYAERVRHPGHPPASYAAELAELAGRALPIGLSPLLAVDTTDFATIDMEAIARWVVEVLDLPGPVACGHMEPGAARKHHR